MNLENDNSILQNLKDAGCDNQFIEIFFQLKGENNKKRLLVLLERHKTVLLDSLHNFQKKIDCLDYLVYQINQENKEKTI